jgi:hypothetical protein
VVIFVLMYCIGSCLDVYVSVMGLEDISTPLMVGHDRFWSLFQDINCSYGFDYPLVSVMCHHVGHL